MFIEELLFCPSILEKLSKPSVWDILTAIGTFGACIISLIISLHQLFKNSKKNWIKLNNIEYGIPGISFTTLIEYKTDLNIQINNIILSFNGIEITFKKQYNSDFNIMYSAISIYNNKLNSIVSNLDNDPISIKTFYDTIKHINLKKINKITRRINANITYIDSHLSRKEQIKFINFLQSIKNKIENKEQK